MAETNRCAAAFRPAQDVGVAFLPHDLQGLAERFSGGALPGDRFDAAEWDHDPHAPPRLHAAPAHLRGLVRSCLDAGAHEVLVFDVQEVVLGGLGEEGALLIPDA